MAYSLANILRSNFNSLNLIGFDGTENDRSDFGDILKILNIYNNQKSNKELISLTPTKYPIKEKSLFLFI